MLFSQTRNYVSKRWKSTLSLVFLQINGSHKYCSAWRNERIHFHKKMEKEAKKIKNWSWDQKTFSMRCLSLPRHLLPFEVSTAMVKIYLLEVWIQICCSVLFSLLTPILLSPASAAPSPNELYPEEEGVTSLCDLAIFKHKFYLTTFANQSNFINFIKIYAIYNFLSS